MRWSVLFLVLTVAGVATARAPGAGAKSEARRHWDEGQRLYEAGRYDDAIREFRAGYALEPNPEFLYALGQTERRKGDCRAALEYYRGFLRLVAGAAQIEAAQLQIRRCEDQLAGSVRAGVPPAPPTVASSTSRPGSGLAPEPALAVRPAARPWYTDWLGGTLAVGGLAAVVAGSTLLADAGRTVSPSGRTYGGYDAALETRDHKRIAGATVAAGGALLAGMAVLRYRLRHRNRVGLAIVGGTRSAEVFAVVRFR
jgi:tetratricopeptide (TPR) repeat protein